MMTIPVYATNSFQCPITSKSDGYDTSCTFREEEARSAAIIEANTEYAFMYTWKKPIPGVKSSTGCRLRFDMRTVPAFQGARIRFVRGPYIFLRERIAHLEAQNVDSINQWFDLWQIFIVFFIRYPNNPGQYNVLGSAALNAYFDTRGERNDTVLDLRDGVQTCDVVVGAASCPPYEGKMYRGNVRALFDSHIGANRPYLNVEYEAAPIQVIDCVPQSGSVNEKASSRFSWAIALMSPGAADIIGTPVQKSAVIYWRVKGGSTFNSVGMTGANTFIYVAANTFPNLQTIEWKVSVTTTLDGIAESGLYAFTTVDAIPYAPRSLYPNGIAIDGTIAHDFSWKHIIDTGTSQSKFDLQYSTDNRTWKILATQSTTKESYRITADYFSGGTIYWRVRTFSSDDGVGPWATATVSVQNASPSPAVSATNAPRTTATWQSYDQVSFQIHIFNSYGMVEYDSGEQYGTGKRYQIPIFLADGRYSVDVRTLNQYDLWSDWGSANITIANQPGSELALEQRSVENGAEISWDGMEDFETFLIYRDGTLIGQTPYSGFIDYMANGLHRYQVRGVKSTQHYAMSDIILARTQVRSGVIAEIRWSDYLFHWLPLEYRRGSKPGHSRDMTQQITYKNYSGRVLPEAEIYPYRSVTHRLSLSMRKLEDLAELEKLLAKEVIYKDSYGAVIIGLLDSISSSDDRKITDFEISITETNRLEGVTIG